MLIAPGTVGRIGAGSRRVATLRVGASVNITVSDPITTDDTPTIAGYVTNPGGTIEGLIGDVYQDGVVVGQTSATDATGFWSYTFATLTDGVYAIDVVFPVLLVSDEVSFTVDGEAVVLSALTLDNLSVDEEQASGTVVGVISGNTAGSVLTLSNSAGGRFQIVEASTDVWEVRTTSTVLSYEDAATRNIQVRETNGAAGNSPRDTSFTITINNSALPPGNTVAPAVTGNAIEGQTLSCTTGTWSNSPTSYAYQWKRGATNVGTGSATYVLVAADIGSTMTCTVTATNSEGSTPQVSNTTGTVAELWDPSNGMSGVTLSSWHDVQDGATVTQSGGKVSQVTDKSGNSRTWTQATGGNQPTYGATAINGRPALTSTGGASTVNMSWAMEAALGACSAYHITNTSTLRVELNSTITGASQANCDFTVDMTTAKSLVCVCDATADTVKLYADGNLIGTVSTAIALNVVFCWTGYIVSMGGSDQPRYWTNTRLLNSALGTRSLNGGLGGLHIWTKASAFITAEIERLCGYGFWHWGTQAAAPSGHTYETAPPPV